MKIQKTRALDILLNIAIGLLINITFFRALSVTDVIAVLAFPFIVRRRIYTTTSWKRISIIICFFAATLTASDHFARGIDFESISNVIKYLTIIPLALLFSYLMKKSPLGASFILFGYALGRIFVIELEDMQFWSTYNYWRHGIGEGAGLALLCIALVARKSAKFSAGVLISGLTLYVWLDFRAMALTYLIALAILFAGWFASQKQRYNRLLAVSGASFFLASMVLAYGIIDPSALVTDRQEMSNAIRVPMFLYGVKDIFEPSILGDGYDAFMDDFDINVSTSALSEHFDLMALRQHGYLFVANTEGGKVGLVLFIYIYWSFYTASRLLVRYPYLSAYFYWVMPLMVYAFLGSFLLVFFEFDRFLLALAIAGSGLVIEAAKKSGS